MSKKIWTASADVNANGIHRRGLLIGSYETAADADQAFRRLIGLSPVTVAPGLHWSTLVEELVSRTAWNALTCEHHVRQRDVFLCISIELSSLELEASLECSVPRTGDPPFPSNLDPPLLSR
ncbi:hypothetical protein [Roseateles amylovorans]|uniref:SPOR domain-containing protein n=1 Tax=Roseateles amylovorans TaxID=2978473 RepID=A0ABY6AUF2_9BURK|nr:hypothetical protein [Roseateles amylovorans]UXH76200.1 hypothetical protein N4261_14090 [Roseateles amylovorans]